MRTSATLFLVSVCAAFASPGYAGNAPAPKGWSTPATGKPAYWTRNTITVRQNRLRWNGVTVDEVTLLRYIRESATLNPLPLLVFDAQPQGNGYARHIRDLIDKSYPCRVGACFQGSPLALHRTQSRSSKGPPS